MTPCCEGSKIFVARAWAACAVRKSKTLTVLKASVFECISLYEPSQEKTCFLDTYGRKSVAQ